MDLNVLKDYFVLLFKAEIIEDTESKIIFKLFNKDIELDKNHFEQINTKLTNNLNSDETEIYNDFSYEILVRDSSRFLIGREREHCINDEVNGIKYSYGKPSDEYIIFFLERLFNFKDSPLFKRTIDPFRFRRRKYSQGEEDQNELFKSSVFDVIKESIYHFETLRIESTNSTKKSQFEQFCYSYIFTLSYNISKTIYPLRFFDEFMVPLHIGRIRRSSLEEMEPPKRLYINDLILFYQKGLSSESLDHQYLSFYHTLEHFFEQIYNEDLIDNIKSTLTKPGFSYKKKKDIESLIKVIQNRLRYKNEEFQLNEIEALELTLIKFLNLDEIKNELNNTFNNITEYYKTTEVPFSKGNKVNFDNPNIDEIYKNLAKRIYLTRNSIVHSKETEKEKYIPFRDDKDLISEVLLMQVITEQVIIYNSKEI